MDVGVEDKPRKKAPKNGEVQFVPIFDYHSIAAWLNEWVIFDDNAVTQIGCDRSEWDGRTYLPGDSTLFGSYSLYCRQTGLQAKGKNNFSADLIDLCQQVLSKVGVFYERYKSTGKRCIQGLRLRSVSDNEIQTLDESLTTDRQLTDNLTDNLEVSPIKDSDNPDNLLVKNLSNTSSPSQINDKDLSSVEGFNYIDKNITNLSSPLFANEEDLSKPNVSNCDVVKNAVNPDIEPQSRLSEGLSEGSSESKTPSLLNKLVQVWNDITALGAMVLNMSEQELIAAVKNFTQEQIAYIKKAAHSVWKPGLNRDVDYLGERCSVWSVGFGREVTIALSTGTKIKVKLGNLRPWLGI